MSITVYNSHSTTIIVDNSKYSKRMHCSTSLWWYCYDFSLQNGRMRWELCNPCLMYYVSYFFVIRDIFVGDVSSGVAWLAPRHCSFVMIACRSNFPTDCISTRKVCARVIVSGDFLISSMERDSILFHYWNFVTLNSMRTYVFIYEQTTFLIKNCSRLS